MHFLAFAECPEKICLVWNKTLRYHHVVSNFLLNNKTKLGRQMNKRKCEAEWTRKIKKITKVVEDSGLHS